MFFQARGVGGAASNCTVDSGAVICSDEPPPPRKRRELTDVRSRLRRRYTGGSGLATFVTRARSHPVVPRPMKWLAHRAHHERF